MPCTACMIFLYTHRFFQVQDGGLEDDRKVWYANEAYPNTSAVMQLAWDGDIGIGALHCTDSDGVVELLDSLEQEIRDVWGNKSATLTYPREVHDEVDHLVTYRAKVRKQWLQPGALYIHSRSTRVPARVLKGSGRMGGGLAAEAKSVVQNADR